MTTEQVAAPINPWKVAQQQFDLAADKLDLDPGLRHVLRECRRELTVHFPVKMDDGNVQVMTGYRVQHNLGRGPAKGGIRYHHDVPRRVGPRDVDDRKCGRRITAAARRVCPQSSDEETGAPPGAFPEISVLVGPERDIPRLTSTRRPRSWPGSGHLLHARGLHGSGRGHRQADQHRRVRGPQ
jgi:hypothetical protein